MKKRITDTATIDAVLAKVNGKAHTFTINSAAEIVAAAEEAEAILASRGVSKAHRAGTKAVFIPAGPASKAYRWAVSSTRVELLRTSGGWFVVGVAGHARFPKDPRVLGLRISPAAADDVARHAMRGLMVDAAPIAAANILAAA